MSLKKTAVTMAIVLVIASLFIVPVIAEGPFYGSKNSNVYHYGSCSYVDRIKDANLVIFTNAQDAVDRGYRPCDVCHPPLPVASNPSPLATSGPSPTVPELTPLALMAALGLLTVGAVVLRRRDRHD